MLSEAIGQEEGSGGKIGGWEGGRRFFFWGGGGEALLPGLGRIYIGAGV